MDNAETTFVRQCIPDLNSGNWKSSPIPMVDS